MTESDAKARLEVAILDYARAIGQQIDDDYLTAWVVVTQHALISDADCSAIALLSPPTVTPALQLGLLRYAQMRVEAALLED